MRSDEFNANLRNIFRNLESDGFISNHISGATFGQNRMDMYKEFMNGRDIGLKPLSNIFDAMGFDFCLVPVLKNDRKMKEKLSEMSDEALTITYSILLKYLENRKTYKDIRSQFKLSRFVKRKIREIRKLEESKN